MKHENRISKILEKKILKDFDPKEIAQIDEFLLRLEKVWLDWTKEHPNWKKYES